MNMYRCWWQVEDTTERGCSWQRWWSISVLAGRVERDWQLVDRYCARRTRLWLRIDAAGPKVVQKYSTRTQNERMVRIGDWQGGLEGLYALGRSSGSRSRQHDSRLRDSCSKADSSMQRYRTIDMQREQKPVFEKFGRLNVPVASWTVAAERRECNNFDGVADCTGYQQDRSDCRSGSCTGPYRCDRK
jgi:hypothetical protein